MKANKRANVVPLFSKLASHKSFITPAPTLNDGPAKIPDRDLAIAIVAKVLADPPTILKMRDRGIVTRYMWRYGTIMMEEAWFYSLITMGLIYGSTTSAY